MYLEMHDTNLVRIPAGPKKGGWDYWSAGCLMGRVHRLSISGRIGPPRDRYREDLVAIAMGHLPWLLQPAAPSLQTERACVAMPSCTNVTSTRAVKPLSEACSATGSQRASGAIPVRSARAHSSRLGNQ